MNLRRKGMTVAGCSPDKRIVEMIEVVDHPYFVGTQGHPEFKSRPNHAHPLFRGLVTAAAHCCIMGREETKSNKIPRKGWKQMSEMKGLYREQFEHDNCGIGAVVNSNGVRSHKTVENALHIVENLEHRAGKDAEGKTGDGVGILLQVSHKFFSKVAKEEGFDIGGERDYGVAQLFLPQDEMKRNQAKKMFEIIAGKEGLTLLRLP